MAIGCGLLTLLCLAGCGPQTPEAAPAPVPAILPPPGCEASVLKQLEGWYPDALWVHRTDLTAGLARCLREDRVLLLPGAAHLPLDDIPALLQFLGDGGRLLILGTDPFSEGLLRQENGYTTRREREAQYMADARPVARGIRIELWEHEPDPGRTRGAVRIAPSGQVPWPAVLVSVDDFDRSDRLVSPDISPGALSIGAGTELAFYARGEAATTGLVLLMETVDGNRWAAPITVAPVWRPYLLAPSDFRRVGRMGGVGDDRLRDFDGVYRLQVGLDAGLALQAGGAHLFGVSEIRLVVPKRPDKAGPDPLIFSREGGVFDLRAPTVRSVVPGRPAWALYGARVQSARPAPRGTGVPDIGAVRWKPLYEVRDPGEKIVGWPAALYFNSPGEGPLQRWGWVGIDPGPQTASAVRGVLDESLRALSQPAVLTGGGSRTWVYEPGERLGVVANWARAAGSTVGLRVTAELIEGPEFVVRRVISPALEEGARGSERLDLGAAPAVNNPARDFKVRLRLEEAEGARRTLDEIIQPLTVVKPRTQVGDAEWVVPTGPRFTLRKRNLFLLGVRYRPATRIPGSTQSPSWLHPSCFDAEVVGRDLDRLKEKGVNTLGLDYQSMDEANVLRFVLDEARRRKMKVLLRVAGLDPWHPDVEGALALMQAARLKYQPVVFAFELPGRTAVGPEQERRALDGAWVDWLREQFGSLEHAAEQLGGTLPRHQGQVTGPSDAALRAEGPSTPFVAAYRRCLDDLLSRRIGAIRRRLAEAGYPQLLCSRNGAAWCGHDAYDLLPVDPAAGAAHLDFISLSADGLYGGPAHTYAAALLAAYARGVSAGKPVVWLDAGADAGPHPRRADLTAQAEAQAQLFTMALRSCAAGVLGRCEQDEAEGWSGTALLKPDGAPRPVADVFRRFANRLRGNRRSPRIWRGRAFDRYRAARGFGAVWDAWESVYADETARDAVEEMRAEQFGVRTALLADRLPGGHPRQAPAPLDGANAEWGAVWVDGKPDRCHGQRALSVEIRQTLRLELLNTGLSTWGAARGRGGAVVVARHATRKPQRMSVPPTAYGERAVIDWVASDLGSWTFRVEEEGLGAFGEALTVNVNPRRALVRP